MKLYRHWARAERHITDAEGNPLWLRKWGGANSSPEEALTIATRKLDELVTRLQQKADLRWAKDYTYSTRDLPEELIEELAPGAGITRNRLGCLVLNVADVCIADIDRKGGGIGGFLKRLFCKKESWEAGQLDRLKAWLAAHPGSGARAYRTAGGLRYIFTHGRAPVNEDSLATLRALGSDRLYVFLCQQQDCYRARLSPKPWRLQRQLERTLERVPFYPRSTPEAEQAFAEWLHDYETQSQAFAVCHFLGHFGDTHSESELARLVETHDRATAAHSGRPLA